MSNGTDHLCALFGAAALGRFPDVDGEVEFFSLSDEMRDAGLHGVVVEFAGHAVVFSDVEPHIAVDHGADGYGGATAPAMMTLLCGDRAAIEHSGVVYAGMGEGGLPLPQTQAWDGHARVRRARRTRTGVSVFGDDAVCVTLGRGLGGRLEVGIEVAEHGRGAGIGPTALERTRRAVPCARPVFGVAAPGNVRAARALLAAGFRPVAYEVVIEASTHARRDGGPRHSS